MLKGDNMSSSNYFLEAAFVDDSDFAREVYEEALYGEMEDDFEYYDWSER